MKIDILTLFPGMFPGPLENSLIGRARARGLLDITVTDIRGFARGRHRIADDRSFGGGPGMVMKVEPIHRALRSVGALTPSRGRKVVYLSPQGRPLTTLRARALAGVRHLVLLCGHYEGVDERVMRWVDEEISIGDYVLTGGELPALVVIDALARFIPGVVKEQESVEGDSFAAGLLDWPHYTRPARYCDMRVPAVLTSGDHQRVQAWRRSQAIIRTVKRRPDVLSAAALSDKERRFVHSALTKRRNRKE